MNRKSYKDLRQEYIDICNKRLSLEKKIIKRANELTKTFPEAFIAVNCHHCTKQVLAKKFTDKIAGVDEALNIIEAIEKYNESQSPFIQGELFN